MACVRKNNLCEHELKLPYRNYLREMTVQALWKILSEWKPVFGSNGLFTFTDADSDSNLIPVLCSVGYESETDAVQYEKFCILQCSHLFCSLNWSRNPDLEM